MTSFRDWIVTENAALRAAIDALTSSLAALTARVNDLDELAAPPPGAVADLPAKPAVPIDASAIKPRVHSRPDYQDTLAAYLALRHRHPGMTDAQVIQALSQQGGGSPSEQTIRVRLIKCGLKIARRPGRPLDAEARQILRLEAERLRRDNPTWARFRVARTAMQNLKLTCSESHACSVIAQP